jgi:hypothetical protein
VRELIKANVDLKNNDGETVLDIARKNNNKIIILDQHKK